MFTINGEQWYIQYVSPMHPMLRRSDGSTSIGVCDDITKTIYINQYLNNRMLKKVLCHELTHAAMFSYNVELNIYEEELLADLIATYGEEIVDITDTLFDKIRMERY